MDCYYVYYKVRADAAGPQLRDALRRMQAVLALRTGVAGRVLQRADDPATWMEVYEDVADTAAFEAALREALADHRIADWLEPDTARHLERFTPCA